MKRLWVCALIVVTLTVSCTKKIYVPVERHTTKTIVERDTIQTVKLVKERETITVKDTIVWAETLYSKAHAILEGSNLSLTIWNKDFAPVQIKTIHTHTIDSIPYPVEVVKIVKEKYVPWYAKGMLVIGIGMFIISCIGYVIK